MAEMQVEESAGAFGGASKVHGAHVRLRDGRMTVGSALVHVDVSPYAITAGEYRDGPAVRVGALFFVRRQTEMSVRMSEVPGTPTYEVGDFGVVDVVGGMAQVVLRDAGILQDRAG